MVKYEVVTERMKIEESRDRLNMQKNVRSIIADNSTDKGNMYKDLYVEALQQLECEKKLSHSMTDALENKVSELIAEMSTLKLSNIQLQNSSQNYQSEIDGLKKQITNL